MPPNCQALGACGFIGLSLAEANIPSLLSLSASLPTGKGVDEMTVNSKCLVANQVVEDLCVRPLEPEVSVLGSHNLIRRYGTVDAGLELCCTAWPRLEHVFSCAGSLDRRSAPGRPTAAHELGPGENVSEKVLLRHPVDLLAVEAYRVHRKVSLTQPVTFWERWVAKAAGKPDRPRLVIESWEPAALFTSGIGPLDKASRTRWLELGYQTRGRVLRATELGGAIDQERLLVVRTRMGMATEGWQWPESPRTLPTRPMANLLRPAALVPKRALCSGSPPEGAAEAVSGRTTAATSPASGDTMPDTGRCLPRADHDPMPGRVGAIIETSDGPRHLLDDELAKGLGAPKDWFSGRPARRSLERTTSAYHWEGLTPSILSFGDLRPNGRQSKRAADESVPAQYEPHPACAPAEETVTCREDNGEDPEVAPFEWQPPDMSDDSPWY